MNIVNKIVGENKKSWVSNMKYALWADCTTTNTSTGKIHFDLFFKLEAYLPINLQIPMLQISQQFSIDKEALQGIIYQLMELDET
jgi:hypothetical protein